MIYTDTVADQISISRSIIVGRPDTITQRVNFTSNIIFGMPITATDSIDITPAALSYYALNGSIQDIVNIVEQIQGQADYYVTLSDTAKLTAAVYAGLVATLSDDFTIEDVLSVVKAVAVLEQLGLGDVLAASTKYTHTVTDAVTLLDALRRFISEDVTESIGFTSTLLSKKNMFVTSSDTAQVQDVLDKHFVIKITANETVNIDDVDVVNLLWNETLIDQFDITAAYIAPGDNFTTWTINTRTGATTEYTNYVFNSFAKFGNTYIGANSEGLFELQGTTDAGTDIIAAVKSGLMQMASTKFTMFRAAYLGIRGEGDFVLRLVSGDGDVFNYSFNANSMITTKVPLGKGLRARYFSFELISDEMDFDMESIEFIPLVARRRV